MPLLPRRSTKWKDRAISYFSSLETWMWKPRMHVKASNRDDDLMFQNSATVEPLACIPLYFSLQLNNDNVSSTLRLPHAFPLGRKVVATNIAKTSLTIDDIVYVVEGLRRSQTDSLHFSIAKGWTGWTHGIWQVLQAVYRMSIHEHGWTDASRDSDE